MSAHIVTSPRILDLFCGVGGASEGYRRAGWEVFGVDLAPQPYYPFRFTREDALFALSTWDLRDFDAIHASPPCQAYTALQKGTNAALGRSYPSFYEPLKEALCAIGLPYVIENPAARPDVVLCGEMFGLGVIRHRNFELNWPTEWDAGLHPAQPAHRKHRGRVRGWRHGVYYDGPYIAAYGNGGGKGGVQEMKNAMDIHWTNSRHSLTEAIPPAYTECIGIALKAHLDRS